MKLFHLYRVEDQSGVSGTGPVVEGVEFTNGWCAIRWLSNKSTLCFYQSIEDVRSIHSHGGKTELIVHDFQPTQARTPGSSGGPQFEAFLQAIEETTRLMNLADEPDIQSGDILSAVTSAKQRLDELGQAISRSLGKKLGRAS